MIKKRQVFYSFHYNPDNWRVSTIRNIGVIEGNRPVTDNDWQRITMGGDDAIKQWIEDQLDYRSCTLVLVGRNTANRRWINYEIVRSWDKGMGVAGIYIHNLKDQHGLTTIKGANPFDYITHGNSRKLLSSIVPCYNPTAIDSKQCYNWIAENISAIIEEAIKIRETN